MEKIRIAIAGYGNLGKASEEHLLNSSDMDLAYIVSRRKNIETKSNVTILDPDEVLNYKDKIDVMVLCGGSAKDLPEQTPYYAKHFNTVDSYDNHSKLYDYYMSVDKVAKESGKLSIISIGFDPGLFSLNRMLFESILNDGKTYTFYGPGISQGHSDAIRRIEGVEDGRQYTLPIEAAMDKVRNGEMPELTKRDMHLRRCYVVAKEGADKDRIKEEIINMPGYFADNDTSVEFITKEELLENHKGLAHGGFVMRTGQDQLMEFSLKLDSNPRFTSAVLLAYARAAYRMNKRGQKGAFTILDVEPSLIINKTKEELLRNFI